MNGYSSQVEKLSNESLLAKHKQLEKSARYSNPAQDAHWLYRAILEELKRRDIDPSQTITTKTGMVIPCDSEGRAHRDQPERFIRYRN